MCQATLAVVARRPLASSGQTGPWLPRAPLAPGVCKGFPTACKALQARALVWGSLAWFENADTSQAGCSRLHRARAVLACYPAHALKRNRSPHSASWKPMFGSEAKHQPQWGFAPESHPRLFPS